MGRFRPGHSGNPLGRPRGARNKIPTEVRTMLLRALEHAGGEDYLRQQAEVNPTAFLTLVGKLLPARLDTGSEQSPVTIVVRRPW